MGKLSLDLLMDRFGILYQKGNLAIVVTMTEHLMDPNFLFGFNIN